MKSFSCLIALLVSLIFIGCGGKEKTEKVTSNPAPAKEVAEKPTAAKSVAAFNDSILGDGLQATLKLAAERAVAELSKPGGFADNEALRIGLPESMAPVESTLKKLGQEKLLNDFKDSLNEAARSSVAASPKILSNSISGMKMEDVLSLWKGEKDAATRYLESHTRKNIEEEMLPIISEKTAASGATKYFKQIADLLPKKSSGGLLDSLAAKLKVEIPSDFDLDKYVSEKALNGLYATLATEEAKIRENPAARSTELIKNAFDYFSKK
jgi:hypothetical protein